jgi:thymidylate synthase (FAD)
MNKFVKMNNSGSATMNEIRVLDHGWVRLLNVAGPTRRAGKWDDVSSHFSEFDADDTDPANSARMSFGQRDSGRTREQDLQLVEYLLRNHHTTPIEMIETWWEMKLPIFVARQLVRHRTVSINEVSARYVALPEEWYIPADAQVGGKAATNKQGRGEPIEPATIAVFQHTLNKSCAESYHHYQNALRDGIAPEVARNFLHVNHYTQWLWKQNLHNLFHMLKLRLHPHAQWETQQYAQAVLTLLRTALPDLTKIWEDLQ